MPISYTKFLEKVISTRIQRARNKVISTPWKLLIEIIRTCNHHCINCNIWASKNKSILPLNIYEKLFQDNKNLFWLSLTGGEPYLRKDMVKIVDVALENCPDLKVLSIPTTGYMVNRTIEITKELMERPIETHITISLDGPKEVNDKIRGIKNAYENSLESFKALKDIGANVRYQATVHKENIDIFREFYDKFKEDIGVLTFTQTSETYYDNINVKSLEGNKPAELFEHLSKNFSLRQKHDIIEKMHLKIAAKYLRKKDMMLPCTAGFSGAFISSDGNVYPCFLMKSWGNLKEKSFKDVWFSYLAHEQRQIIKEKKCPKCWINCFSFQDMVTYPEKAIVKAFINKN